MNDIAIRFDHVGKLYKLGLVGTGTLSHDLNRWWKTTILRQEDPYLKIGETNDRSKKGASEYVWALKDNHLRCASRRCSRHYRKKRCREVHLVETSVACHLPYTGAIRAVAALPLSWKSVPVSSGTDGRENIYMNGSIMGMTRHEISHKLDEIVDFCRCGTLCRYPRKTLFQRHDRPSGLCRSRFSGTGNTGSR